MAEARRLPIGVQSFKVAREDNFIYIDKTEFIWKLAAESRVHFLSRPRRFGKSLLLSTMQAYFLGQKELFTGLAIEGLEEAEADKREVWQEYPVFYLDFNAESYRDISCFETILNNHLCLWEAVYGAVDTENTFSSRFKGLIRRAYEKTGKQVVVLVDEYDKPLLETMHDNPALNDEYRKILKGFYGVLKSSDQYLRFAFLTGVTKFSKVSIFSDLNNLRDLSLEEDYAAICGITEAELKANLQPEIEALAAKNGLSYEASLAALKKQYDGYMFSENGAAMYNPFSILNALQSRKLDNYWFATGTPTFLVELLKKNSLDVRDIVEHAEMSANDLMDYRPSIENPVPIFYQAGYLTIKAYDSRFNLYKLGFPNEEVRYGFLHNLLPDYTAIHKDKSGLFIGNFVRDIEKGNVEGFMSRMYAACAGLPYSMAAQGNTKLRERDYQIAFYIIFTLMGQFTQTEVHSAKGRADCVVHTPDAVYVFEFKLLGSGTAQEAIQQIKEKGYAEPYRMSGKKVVLIGAAFDDGTDYDEDDTSWWVQHVYV